MKCFKPIMLILVMLCAFAVGYRSTQAEPILVSHQGRLLDAADAPVTNGTYAFRFSLWTDSTSGTEAWFELQDISVQKGLFNTYLGRSTNLSPVLDQYSGQPLFLQTQVTVNGGVVVLSPRLRLGTVPTAAIAKRLSGDTVSGSGHSIFTNTNQAGSTELRVISLNGLPPGEPVTGVDITSINDSATVNVGVAKFGELKGIVAGTTSIVGSSTSSRLAIKTKGTGAQRSSYTAEALDDGATSSSAAFRAINTTGTGATVRVMASASDSGALSLLDADDDGDAVIDEEIRQQCGNDSVTVSHSVYDHGALATEYTARQGKTGATKRLVFVSGSAGSSSYESADADSAVFQQSYSSGGKLLSYTAKAGKTGSAKRTTNQNGSSGSSSSEFGDADSIVYADSVFDNGQPQSSYKATQGKTGKAAKCKFADADGDESSSEMRASADSVVTVDSFLVNSATAASYTAKAGKTGSAKQAKCRDSNGHETSSVSIFGLDSVVVVDSFQVNGATAASYTAKAGKTGSAKQAKITDDEGDESSSSERSTADSTVFDDTFHHGGALQAEFTAKTGKSGRFKRSLVVSGDDESSASENHTVDSITHDESVTVNGVVVSQYTAKQGSSGRTKRTIQHSGTTEYASTEEVDNNGTRMYMTTDNGNPGTPLDTGFYVDNNGNMRLSANGTFGIEINNAGTTNVKGRLGIGVLSPANPLELASGAHCTAGGVFTNASDVNLKENFKPVNEEALLDKVEQLPISQWNYKNEDDNVTHIGPTAQDFKAIFGVGDNDKSISTIDPAGIALAAIKELRKENRDLKGENVELKKRLDDLQKKVEALLSQK